jgi:hypothetical protein
MPTFAICKGSAPKLHPDCSSLSCTIYEASM